jgi:hypothetical protein
MCISFQYLSEGGTLSEDFVSKNKKAELLIWRGLKNPTKTSLKYWTEGIDIFTKWINIQISYNQRFIEIFE